MIKVSRFYTRQGGGFKVVHGYIGFDALNHIVHHPQLMDLPKILETPYVGEDKKNKQPPYRFEIDMFRKQGFNPNLLDDIINQ